MGDKLVVDIRSTLLQWQYKHTCCIGFQTKLMEFVRVLTGNDREMWLVLRRLLDALNVTRGRLGYIMVAKQSGK